MGRLMERIIWGFCLVIAVFMTFGLGRLYERDQWRPVVTATVQEIGRLELAVDGESARVAEMVLRIVECESSFRHDGIWGDGRRSFGIAQFQEPTFRQMAQAMGREELQWKNRRDQLIVLSWAVRTGQATHWTCYRRLVADGS